MSTIELRNKTFELIENEEGHALESTRMAFGSAQDPFTAIYSGPNTSLGQVLVSDSRMLYQSADLEGNLSAGEAAISFAQTNGTSTMVLNWRWLTGDQSSGISKWREVDT